MRRGDMLGLHMIQQNNRRGLAVAQSVKRINNSSPEYAVALLYTGSSSPLRSVRNVSLLKKSNQDSNSQGPSYALSQPTTMNRQEETTKSLKTTQLAQGRTELPPQKDDALGHHILTLLLPDSTSWSMGKGLHARDVTDHDPSEGEAL